MERYTRIIKYTEGVYSIEYDASIFNAWITGTIKYHPESSKNLDLEVAIGPIDKLPRRSYEERKNRAILMAKRELDQLSGYHEGDAMLTVRRALDQRIKR